MSTYVTQRLAAQLAASAAKVVGGDPAPKKERIDNSKLIADTGLKIIHFNTTGRKRPVTIAYSASRDMVEFSTAITHPDDTFVKKIGTKTAIEAFLAGRTVRIPLRIGFQYGPGDIVSFFRRFI